MRCRLFVPVYVLPTLPLLQARLQPLLMGRSAVLPGLQHMVKMACGQMTKLLRAPRLVSMAQLADASSAKQMSQRSGRGVHIR